MLYMKLINTMLNLYFECETATFRGEMNMFSCNTNRESCQSVALGEAECAMALSLVSQHNVLDVQ